MQMTGMVSRDQEIGASPLSSDSTGVLDFLFRLTAAIELREQDGRTHGERVAAVARHLALRAGCAPSFADDLAAIRPHPVVR